MTDPLGQAETYTYDINGNLLTKLDRNNAATAYTYDQTGRLTRVAVTKAGARSPQLHVRTQRSKAEREQRRRHD